MKDQSMSARQGHGMSQVADNIPAMDPSSLYHPGPLYFGYWGKARPTEQGPALHLLPYHCLDVAAVGVVYLRHQPALESWLAGRLGAKDAQSLRNWLAFWLSVHDLGKFSISFQGQRADLVSELQGNAPSSLGPAGVRHDSLGFVFWRQHVQPVVREQRWFGDDPDTQDGTDCWLRAVTG